MQVYYHLNMFSLMKAKNIYLCGVGWSLIQFKDIGRRNRIVHREIDATVALK